MKVVDRNNKHKGMVGVIQVITDDDDDCYVYVRSDDDLNTHVFLRDELKVVQNAQTAISSEPTPKSTALHQTPSNGEDSVTGGLKVGDKVQVVERDDEYKGMLGVVNEITNEKDGYNVYVAFGGRPDTLAFRGDELKLVRAAAPKPAPQKSPQGHKPAPPRQNPSTAQSVPGWYPDPGGSGGKRYWDGQSWSAYAPPRIGSPFVAWWRRQTKGAKVALIIGAVVLTAFVIGGIAANSHSQAWKDCVRQGQSSIDGTPGNTQKDLEHYCEITVGR